MTSNENTIPCVICHHSLDRGSIFDSELLEPESGFGNGLMNTVFGTAATIGAVINPKFDRPTQKIIPPTFYAPRLKPRFKG